MAFWSREKPADPIFERLQHLQAEIAVVELEQHLAMIAPEELATPGVVPEARGLTQQSPFVEAESHSRSLVPWRNKVVEARSTVPAPPAAQVRRAGFVNGIPIGGTTETNGGGSGVAGTVDRDSSMDELLGVYLTCTWSSTCVDAIARTITAGGLTVAPDQMDADDEEEPVPPHEVERIQGLLDYCNPTDDIRQLMRRVITDALIFADSFTEVTWLYGEPVALWPLDCQTMHVITDEHGNVGKLNPQTGKLVGYVQTTDTGRRVEFEPHEIIHVKMDAPGASIYGVSPTQKALVPIKTWLFAAGLVKETMKKGDPPRLHTDWPLSVPDAEVRKAAQQYASRNLGPKNIGNQYETKGNAQVKELSVNKLDFWLAVKNEARDEILSAYGVPPSKAGVIESGNLGGGTGTEQDKTFRVNTCGPVEELVLEKFTFALCYQAFGVKDWRIKFGEVDWRDDLVVEQIRDIRVRNASWTFNRYRRDIGEPDVEGGDDPVLVDRQNIVLVADLSDYSKAGVAAKQKGTQLDPMAQGQPAAAVPDDPDATDARTPAAIAAGKAKDKQQESVTEAWRRAYEQRIRRVRRELADGLHD